MNKNIEIGRYYIEPHHEDVVFIKDIKDCYIVVDVVEDPQRWWPSFKNRSINIHYFSNYKESKKHNTPLYKLLNI